MIEKVRLRWFDTLNMKMLTGSTVIMQWMQMELNTRTSKKGVMGTG